MTVKDIELLTGLPRANIRFYEAQGLIAPLRGENGYRDYSQQDADTLLRIKLLRSLDISIEDIRSLIKDGCSLTPLLRHQLELIRIRKAELERAEKLCETLISDGAEFATLDARAYLDRDFKPVAADVLPTVPHPFRRFFARSFDLYLYNCIVTGVFMLFGYRLARDEGVGTEFIISLLSVVMMLALEPLLLHRFGTTPGKWIFGMYVTDMLGQRPSYNTGFYRCWDIFRHGWGFHIPIYSLVRLWKSMMACFDGAELPWEGDSILHIKDTRNWRFGLWIAGYALLLVLLTLGSQLQTLPKHTGDLTPAEFAENYNFYACDLGGMLDRMQSDGSWYTPGTVITIMGHDAGQPEVSFETDENGFVRSVTMTRELSGPDAHAPSYKMEIFYAATALARAQDGAVFNAPGMTEFTDFLQESAFDDFSFTFYGITLSCDYELSGYTDTSLGPYPTEDSEYSFTFTMTLD